MRTRRGGREGVPLPGDEAFDGQGGALRYSYDAGRGVTVLEGDTNGDRAADFAIEFTGNKALTEGRLHRRKRCWRRSI